MKHLILMTAVALTGLSAQAKKNCTDLPKDKWMKEADFRKKVEAQGYTINKFKQSGSCYEIYGLNKEGKKVEVYFNPVDTTVVKEKID